MPITIKKDPAKEQPSEKTFAEIFDMIAENLKTIGGQVSELRAHSVDSHLRTCIRAMGYRPRETAEKKASIGELAAQCQQAIGLLKGEVPPKRHEITAMHALTILSNLEAEVRDHLSVDRVLPEADLPAVPNKQP